MYWVSFIVQEAGMYKPYNCALYDALQSIEEAMEVIEEKRKIDTVLSAWVDVFVDGRKTTVFHECYVDAFGSIKRHGV